MVPRDAAPPFTLLDRLATYLAAAPALVLVAFPLVSRTFADMYKDFGGPLPWSTRVALLPWFPLLLAAVVVALLVVASRAGTLSSRRILIAFAFVFGCTSVGLCILAMYLPLFGVAGSIQPE